MRHAAGGIGFQYLIEFAEGVSGLIDLSLGALGQHTTGWLIEGTAGGYAPHSRFRVVADGEVVETPLEPIGTQPAD